MNCLLSYLSILSPHRAGSGGIRAKSALSVIYRERERERIRERTLKEREKRMKRKTEKKKRKETRREGKQRKGAGNHGRGSSRVCKKYDGSFSKERSLLPCKYFPLLPSAFIAKSTRTMTRRGGGERRECSPILAVAY